MPSGKAPHWGHFCDPSPHWGHLGTPPTPPPYCPLPFLARYMVQSFYIPYGDRWLQRGVTTFFPGHIWEFPPKRDDFQVLKLHDYKLEVFYTLL